MADVSAAVKAQRSAASLALGHALDTLKAELKAEIMAEVVPKVIESTLTTVGKVMAGQLASHDRQLIEQLKEFERHIVGEVQKQLDVVRREASNVSTALVVNVATLVREHCEENVSKLLLDVRKDLRDKVISDVRRDQKERAKRKSETEHEQQEQQPGKRVATQPPTSPTTPSFRHMPTLGPKAAVVFTCRDCRQLFSGINCYPMLSRCNKEQYEALCTENEPAAFIRCRDHLPKGPMMQRVLHCQECNQHFDQRADGTLEHLGLLKADDCWIAEGHELIACKFHQRELNWSLGLQ